MKKMFMAVIAIMMTLSASAQFYIYYSDGTVAKVDSISMIAPNESEKPNGPVVYVLDESGFGQLNLYMWGDVNDLNGGWPGMAVTGTEKVNGVELKYFDIGAGNEGLSETLIFSDNGSRQLADYGPVVLSSSKPLYLHITAEGTVEELNIENIIEHDGAVVYILDGMEWGMNTTLYMWGDVSDLNGSWPGMAVTGTEKIGDYTYMYFDMGAANTGLNENLIFSNNGSNQLADYAYTIGENIYLYLTSGGAQLIEDPANPGDVVWFDPRPSAGVGVFSVAEGKTVTFSKGNLQYTQSTNTWSFAENQWDMIGTDNVTGGSVSSGQYGDSKLGDALADKIDLFGWSTSATNFGVSTSKDYNDYNGSFVDWGTNKIGNDAPNTWRTLTYDEWYYLRYTRTNANDLVGVAKVNGVNGLILLPDNWTCPSGVTFKSGFHSNYGVDYYAAYQTFTAAEWSKLEAAGAVFLPASGHRDGSYVNNVQSKGSYWSATELDSVYAYGLYFHSDTANTGHGPHNRGQSVRLVKDL